MVLLSLIGYPCLLLISQQATCGPTQRWWYSCSCPLYCRKDPFNLRRESPIPRSKQSSPSNVTLSKSSDLKRELPHKTRDEENLSHGAKRTKLDSPHNPFKSHTPSPTPSIKSESSSRSRKSDESDSDADMNDLAMEIGINCTVCKSFEQTSGNQLVECQECHNLFHQECHKPPVSHQDMTDPRLVWYCTKCSRSMKKQTSVVSSGQTPSVVGIRAAASISSGSSGKGLGSLPSNSSRPSPSKSIGLQRHSPFANLSSVSSGRSNLGSNSSSNSSGVSGNSTSSSNSSSSSGSSSTRSGISSSSTRSSAAGPPAANSLLNAERRVHLMKKKAAAKNAERRKL